ncbi:MAG TPA: hypothetical protein VH599_11890 [Ktedonobacterales bacterium]
MACWSAGLEGERSPGRSVGRLEGGATSDPDHWWNRTKGGTGVIVEDLLE